MYGTHEPLLIDTTANGADWSAVVGDLIADIAWYDHDEQRAQEFVPDFRYDAEIDEAIDQAILLLSRPVLSLGSALVRGGARIFDFDTDAASDWA